MTPHLNPKEPLVIKQQGDVWIVSVKETSSSRERTVKAGYVKEVGFSIDRISVHSYLSYTLQGQFVGESEMFGVACAMAASKYLGTR